MAPTASVTVDRARGIALLMGGAMLVGAVMLMVEIVTAFSAFAAADRPADSPFPASGSPRIWPAAA